VRLRRNPKGCFIGFFFARKGARWLPVAPRGPGFDGPSQPPEGATLLSFVVVLPPG